MVYKFSLKKRSHWPIRCINSIYIEDGNFEMMTRQLGSKTVKERKFTNTVSSGNEGVQQETAGLNAFLL